MLGGQYFVPLAKRSEVERLFRDMMYAPSYERYCGRREQFAKCVSRISPALVDYFRRNWDACSQRWSNYGRGRRFSAGNNTTNRIEASWNQYKHLIGKKTWVDQCLRVVFNQQACVLRNLAHCVGTHDLRVPSDDFASELDELSGVLLVRTVSRS